MSAAPAEPVASAFGVSTWIWVSPLSDSELARLAPHVRELGFDMIELPVEQPGDWDPARAAELTVESGLATGVCAVMGAGRDLSAEHEETVGATQAYLRGCVDAAVRVGSAIVAGPMYAPVGKLWRLEPAEWSRMIARVAERLRPVAEYAGERGVKLAVEPLNRYETSLVNTVAQGLELVEGVDSPACGLLLDTYHLHIEEKDPAAAARMAGDRIAHVHACGTDRGAPGADSFGWRDFASALADAGYRGPLCIESFTPANQAIAVAASIWRPLAPSQDALASDGLRFLSEIFARRSGW
jgi:D-psicose/D-tagatose/L-ribulose 3-epimerase